MEGEGVKKAIQGDNQTFYGGTVKYFLAFLKNDFERKYFAPLQTQICWANDTKNNTVYTLFPLDYMTKNKGKKYGHVSDS